MSRKTIEDLLKLTSGNEHVTKRNVNNFNDIVEFPRKEQLKNDEDLKDRVSNRSQRENFTKSILIMMAFELIFIAILIFGVFLTPYINALAPRVQLNLPPVFFTICLITLLMVTYKFLNFIPTITISKDNKFRIYIDFENIFKYISILIVIITINCMKRHPYILNFEPINLSENIINMIIYASITVFIKTTVLAGMIITGLYDVLKKK